MSESDRKSGASWQALSDAVLTGMADWRSAHPTATFAEIEAEVEAWLGKLRARLLEDAALVSTARTGVDSGTPAERGRCPVCRGALVVRGEQARQVRIRGDRGVTLRRTYLTCATCGRGFFPPG